MKKMECEVTKGSDTSMVECIQLAEEGSTQTPLLPSNMEIDTKDTLSQETSGASQTDGDETITAKASTSESRIPVPGSGSSASSRRQPLTRNTASAATPLSSALSQRFHHVGVEPKEQEFGYNISERFMSTIDCTNDKNHRGKKYGLSDSTHSRHSDSLRELQKGKSLQGSTRLSPSLCKYQEESPEHESVLARLDRHRGFEESHERSEREHTQPYSNLRLSHDPRESFIRRKKIPLDNDFDDEGDLVSYYSHELPKPKAQRLSYCDSPFSRQLNRFTKGSHEEVNDPCLSFQKARQQRPKPGSQPFHPPSHSHEPPAKPVEISKAELGRRVVIAGAEGGILRYFGRTAFADGEWCGIELERAVGKNDGSIDGVIYFICKANHGIFAPVSKVSLLPRNSIASPSEVSSEHVCYEAQKQDSTKYQSSAHRRSGLPVPKSSSASTSSSESKRRLSDASNKTYTIEVRNEVSLPTSPESIESKISSESPVKPTADPDIPASEVACDGDETSLPSPGDITYDESSLGILTPDQMPDFTVTASASMSLERSPSDENVDALEDEVCEESTTSTRSLTDAAMTPLPAQDFPPIPRDVSLSGLISHSDVHGMEMNKEKSLESPIAETQGGGGSLVKWDSQHSVSGIEDEVLQREVKNIIRELRKTTGEVSSSGSSSPTHKTQDSIGERLPEPNAYPEKENDSEQVFLEANDKEKECKIVSALKEEIIQPDVGKSLCTIEKESDESTNVMPASSSKDVNEFCCNAAVVPSDSTICTVDIEAEAEEEGALSSKILYGNVRSRPTPAWTESVTTSVASMTISVASIDQGYIGDGEFDLRSEGGTGTVNTPTEEVKLFEGVVDVERKLNFDSSTGVTEGDVSLIEDEVEDDPNIIPRDRSARIIDGKLYHSHKELSIRVHEGTASEMESSGFYSDLDPRERDLEDESIKTDPLLETVQEINYDAGTEKGSTPEREFVDLIPKEEPEVDPCRKGEVSPENETEGVSDSGSETKTIQEEEQVMKQPSIPISEATATAESLEASTEANNGEANRADIDKARPTTIDVTPPSQPKSRTYEKPWLSKPPPPKRKEEPKKLLPPPPPMPKKNVQSKLKALLESQASEAASEERRSQRPPKKNKWDEVMNKIAEGQKEEKVKPKVKEIKSKVLESLKAPTVLSPQAEKIRQERRERRERRESRAAAAAAATAAARKVYGAPERKRSIASSRSNRTSRAPSLDSLATEPAFPMYSRSGTPDQFETRDPMVSAYKTNPDRSHGASRPVSPCRSDLSSASDQSHVSNLSRASRISTRRRLVALQNAKAVTSAISNGTAAGTPLSSSCGGPPRRESRVYCGSRSGIGADKIRKKSEADYKAKQEKIKGPKSHKLPPSKASDSTKALKPGPRTSQHHDDGASRQHEDSIKQQLHEETTNRKQLHEQLVKQLQVASKAQKERDVAERNVEALTVLVHYLTQQYDAFSMPWVKSQVESLTEQLARVHLSLDESYAANKRFQEEVVSLKEQHELYIEQLKTQHKEHLEEIDEKHKTYLEEVENSHRSELEKFAKDQQEQLEKVTLQQKEDIQQLEAKWQKSVEEEYERHMKALQQVQEHHVQELNDLKSEHLAKERNWQDVNKTLTQEKENLKQQASKLEETLLNDADYRLQAVRKMCAGLQNEVDSMKMVVDMRNTEIHELRIQVGQMDRLTEELETSREKAKALQAKNEDLKAQMEKKALYERQLMNERRQLAENYQKESNVNKRLSLENEELQWKLRQREDAMSASFSSTGSTSTLDLLTRSPSVGRRHEGSLSPQVPPRSPRLNQRSGGDPPCSSRTDVAKRRGQLGLAPNLEEDNLHSTLESPPPSPCVKAVVEKSNSVSFILDLNESQSDDSFLDIPASPRPRPTRTASLGKADRAFRGPCKNRKTLIKSKSNASDRNGILGSLCGRYEIVKVDSRPQSSSESEHGSELENARQSPTGVSWTVPITKSSENPAQTDVQNDQNQVFSYPHQKEQSFYHNQIEDEYEEMKDGTHQFIEVVELRGRHCFKTDVLNLGSDGKLEMNKLNIMTSSSEGTSESEMSQCDIIKVGTSSESESDSSEDDRLEASLIDDVSLTSHGPLVGSKGSPWCPKEGAGEAMVTDELLSQYNSDALTMDSVESVNTPPCNDDQSHNPHRRLSYGPSSDSDGDTAQLETNDAANVDISWSEDVECDITSSSEMHEI